MNTRKSISSLTMRYPLTCAIALILTGSILLSGCCTHPDKDIVVVKLSPHGEISWINVVNGSCAPSIHSLAGTSDGGAVFSACPNVTDHVYFLEKNGMIRWDLTPKIGSHPIPLSGLVQGSDGGVIGTHEGIAYHFDPKGAFLSTTAIPELFPNDSRKISYFHPTAIATRDGGYAIAGARSLVTLNGNGKETGTGPAGWYVALIEPDNGDFLAASEVPVQPNIAQYPDSDITVDLIIEHIHNHTRIASSKIARYNTSYDTQGSFHPDADGYVFCYRTQYQLWVCERLTKEGKPTGVRQSFTPPDGSLVAASDGGYCMVTIISGKSENPQLADWGPGMYAATMDPLGNITWHKCIPLDLPHYTHLEKIVKTGDGGCVFIFTRYPVPR